MSVDVFYGLLQLPFFGDLMRHEGQDTFFVPYINRKLLSRDKNNVFSVKSKKIVTYPLSHDLIAGLGPLPAIADLSTTRILEAMRHDKKVVSGCLHFVLPTAIGATAIVDDVTDSEMRQALKRVGFRK